MSPTDRPSRPPAPTALVDRRTYLRLAGGVATGAAATLAGCSQGDVPGGDDGVDGADAPDATGLLATAVSDQPGDIDDFESCVVTLDGVWIGPRVGDDAEADGEDESDDEADESPDDAEAEDDGGETGDDDAEAAPETTEKRAAATAAGSQPEDEPDADGQPDDASGDDADGDDGDEDGDGDADDGEEQDDDEEGGEDGDGDGGRTYLEFDEPQEADLVQLQGEASQLVGEHELAVGTYQFLQLDVAGIRGTLTDGSEARVETPGEAPLKFNQSFDVREGYRTTFLADFTPVRRGNGSYLFQPVASETEVSYEEVESGEGGGDDSADDGDAEGGDPDGGDADGSDADDETETDGDDATGDGGAADGTDSN